MERFKKHIILTTKHFQYDIREMKKSVKLAGVEIPLQAITITTSKNSRAI